MSGENGVFCKSEEIILLKWKTLKPRFYISLFFWLSLQRLLRVTKLIGLINK